MSPSVETRPFFRSLFKIRKRSQSLSGLGGYCGMLLQVRCERAHQVISAYPTHKKLEDREFRPIRVVADKQRCGALFYEPTQRMRRLQRRTVISKFFVKARQRRKRPFFDCYEIEAAAAALHFPTYGGSTFSSTNRSRWPEHKLVGSFLLVFGRTTTL